MTIKKDHDKVKDESSENEQMSSPSSQENQGDALLFSKDDPFDLFENWFSEAKTHEINDPNAMALATVDEDGLADVRMVLLKGYDCQGFVFYTNLESAKGRQLLSCPKAALLFHWKSLRRQIRIRGTTSLVTDAEADSYFATRPRQSQIGAWASEQSKEVESRFALEKKVAQQALAFGLGPVPRPPHWMGFRLKPLVFEFWRDGAFRLHDRRQYQRQGDQWIKRRLNP